MQGGSLPEPPFVGDPGRGRSPTLRPPRSPRLASLLQIANTEERSADTSTHPGRAPGKTGAGRPRMAIFTIGHSNRTLDELVALLGAHGVTLLADVRMMPHSA